MLPSAHTTAVFCFSLLLAIICAGCSTPSTLQPPPPLAPIPGERITFHVRWDAPYKQDIGSLDFYADDGTPAHSVWLNDSGMMPAEGAWVTADYAWYLEHPEIKRLRAVVHATPWSPYAGELAVPLDEVRRASREEQIFTIPLKEFSHKTIKMRLLDPKGNPWPAGQAVGLTCPMPDYRGKEAEGKIAARVDADGCLSFCLYDTPTPFTISICVGTVHGKLKYTQPFPLPYSLADQTILDFPIPIAIESK